MKHGWRFYFEEIGSRKDQAQFDFNPHCWTAEAAVSHITIASERLLHF